MHCCRKPAQPHPLSSAKTDSHAAVMRPGNMRLLTDGPVSGGVQQQQHHKTLHRTRSSSEGAGTCAEMQGLTSVSPAVLAGAPPLRGSSPPAAAAASRHAGPCWKLQGLCCHEVAARTCMTARPNVEDSPLLLL